MHMPFYQKLLCVKFLDIYPTLFTDGESGNIIFGLKVK